MQGFQAEDGVKAMEEFDVIIAGAGVTGSAIARELAKTDLKILVLEKEEDVCSGTSKANSGIVHAGYDAKPGSLKARMNVEGNRLMKQLADDLNFDYKQNGSLVLCFSEEGRPGIEELKQRGEINGVPDLQILEKEEILKLEPEVNPDVVCALYAPTAGIVCPFGLNIALAENAADNGVQFLFNTPVETIEKGETGWMINDRWHARAFVNAAGVYAANIHNKVCTDPISITPRKGEYYLFDKAAPCRPEHVLFSQPTKMGKGVLVTQTVHGNLLCGPTAVNQMDFEDVSVSASGLVDIRSKAVVSMPGVHFGSVITSFAGLRAVPDGGDFILQESEDGFFDAAGIESPGLTSAPAIGVYMADLIAEKLNAGKNESFIPFRKGFVNLNEITPEQWQALIEENPAYGTIICRCEMVSQGQIEDACSRSIPAVSLDGVKRRVRAGMGRCQAGFCMPKVMEILAEKQNQSMEQVVKNRSSSWIIDGKIRGKGQHGK